eukprot:TRINITY_DN652_c0_g2_i2.p1 TRINITY_DN652_c0_g2~~TRINITY_DN652_c0_g2_i2.p1  ORF type:complete len:179 (+),score=35.11 TRINITY_DN652_c0_g2_i2:391-927(+)
MAAIGNTLVGAGGEIADFQDLLGSLELMQEEEDYVEMDGIKKGPRAIFTWLSRVLYNRRCKFNPLWNSLVVAGLDKGKPFLGNIDMWGTNYRDDHIATGFGAHLAKPLLRNGYRPDLTEEEAEKLLKECLTVLYYRDRSANNKIHLARVNQDGVKIFEPVELATKWDYKLFISPSMDQ